MLAGKNICFIAREFYLEKLYKKVQSCFTHRNIQASLCDFPADDSALTVPDGAEDRIPKAEDVLSWELGSTLDLWRLAVCLASFHSIANQCRVLQRICIIQNSFMLLQSSVRTGHPVEVNCVCDLLFSKHAGNIISMCSIFFLKRDLIMLSKLGLNSWESRHPPAQISQALELTIGV